MIAKPPKGRRLPIEFMPQVSNVVSDTECTGLAFTAPQTEDELENELDLWSTSLPPVWDEDEKTPHK